MLFTPPPPPENPHAPFTYVNNEIRYVDEHGDRYEADIIQTRGRGWCWTAKYEPADEDDPTIVSFVDSAESEGSECGSEERAVKDAVAWLRAMWDEVRGIE